MSETYTVVQGDHLSRVAERYGFVDYNIIWNHANNAALKKQRENPNVLLPGDTLFIPDLDHKRESRATGQMHRFELKPNQLKLRIIVEDVLFKPVADTGCELSIEGQPFAHTTDATGKLEQDVVPKTELIDLRIKAGGTSVEDEQIPVRVGHLDPIDSISGQKARLNNLGYFAGAVELNDERAFKSAVEEFQCDHMGQSAVDGVCGPKTQDKLKQMHGC